MYEFLEKPISAIAGLLLAVVVIVAAISWHTYTGPKRAFNDMLVNNLTTSAVTKSIVSTTSTTASLQQANLQLNGSDATHWLVTTEQKSGSVTTESIGTQNAGYVRYVHIQGADKSKSYDSLVNVWAKSSKNDTNKSLGSLFSQTMLDVSIVPIPPIGNVNADSRRDMLEYMKGEAVFTPDYAHVKKGVVNGRKVYEYPVSVKLAPYFRVMQAFAHVYGLKDLDSISPSDYQSVEPIKLTISVDTLSHQMLRVSHAASGFSETFSDYGITKNITIPTHTTTTVELQKRFDAVQS
jgi:hypothetical protein